MNRISVLLGDDHKVVRDGLRVMLDAEMDIEVLGDTGEGQEVIRLVRELQPDVIVLDILMPGISGIEVARQIRKINEDAAIVILSMHASREYIFRALDAGCLGYILKESAGSEVIKAIRQVAKGKRYLGSGISDIVINDFLAHDRSPDSPISSLSERELEVIKLVVDGSTSVQIGKLLNISSKSVDTYRRRAMVKLGVNDLPSLVRFAITHGLTTVDMSGDQPGQV
jgi:DNA-binding NarL/FixJ family response regulator